MALVAKEPSETAKLAKQCYEDSVRWFGDTGTQNSLAFMTLALAGEVGELANIVKKIERRSLSIHDAKVRVNLAMETTDVFVYLLNIAHLLNIDLMQSYHYVRGQNEKRFMEERLKRDAEAENNGN